MATFAKTFSKRKKLVPHLDAWFARGKFPDAINFDIHLNKEQDDAFHPSSDSVECIRYLYAKHRGLVEREEIGGTLYKIFQIGHMYHGWLQHILVEELGFSSWDDIEKEHDEYRETPAGNTYRLRGFTDVANCEIPGHGNYLIDIKTVNDHHFRELPISVKAKYEIQCQLYMHWHQKDRGMLLLAQKGTPHEFKEVEFRYDPDVIKSIYQRWELLADGEPPECDCIDASKCPVKGLEFVKV